MKPKNKNRRSGRAAESAAVNLIDLKEECGCAIKAWLKVVRDKKFPTDLKLQNQAALIARGIVIKMQALKAEHGSDDEVLAMAKSIVRDFGQVWEKRSIVVSGPDDGPIEMEHTVRGHMNLGALENAIKRDQET